METIDIAELDNRFAVEGHVSFELGLGDLPIAVIANEYARATIALLGGTVTAFQPHDHAPVLWVSSQARYTVGRPIRGGIPICWPWFGPHPTDNDKPQHGVARQALWNVLDTVATDAGATQIRLGLTATEETRALWPHAFALELVVTVGSELDVALVVHNTGDVSFTYTGALHNYFAVSDVTAISIHGLEGSTYLDKTADYAPYTQDGPVTINAETDSVYQDTAATCEIDDPGLQRRISVAKQGSHTTVVWNPWTDKAKSMRDFGDEEYPGMVCVEAANAFDDTITVAPGETGHLRTHISVTPSEK